MTGGRGGLALAAGSPVHPEQVRNTLSLVVLRGAAYEVTAAEALAALTAAGVRWYVAGGTVRDWVQGHRPRDLDLLVDREIPEVRAALRAAFPGVDPSHRPRPEGYVLQWGSGGDTHLDLAMIRSYRDVRGDVFSTRFRAGHDLVANALVTDFSVNSLCFDPRQEAVLDPLGQGLRDTRERILRLVTHPRVLPAIPQTTLRIVHFLCRGYRPTAGALAHLERRADLDVAAMGDRLPRWLATHLLPGAVAVDDFRRCLLGWLREEENRRRLDRGLLQARERSRAAP